MYGLTSAAVDRPPAPGLGKEAEANKPPALVRKLEGSARGCRALLDTWREMASRVERGWEIQSHDRLKLTRMLGLNPIDVVNDQRVALIFLASFALHTKGKDHAYQDFKSEMGTLEAAGFVERIRSRWPLLLDCGYPARAKAAITDLIARNIERLEAKLEVHQQHEDEKKASRDRLNAADMSPEGDRLARYELALGRQHKRCVDAFWKFRREMEGSIDDGAELEVEEGAGEAENDADLGVKCGSFKEASQATKQNSTNEPETDGSMSEDDILSEVKEIDKTLALAAETVEKLRKGDFSALSTFVDRTGAGPGTLAEMIFGGPPLLRPMT
jgi:hypothetical protein